MTTVQQEVQSNTQSIATNSTSIGTLNQNITTLSQSVQTNINYINTINQTITSIQQQIESINNSIQTLQSSISLLSGNQITFSIDIGDVGSTVESYTSLNNIITSVSTPYVFGGKVIVQIIFDQTKIDQLFGASQLTAFCFYRGKSNQQSALDADNDMKPPVIFFNTRTDLRIMLEESNSSGQNIIIDGIIYKI